MVNEAKEETPRKDNGRIECAMITSSDLEVPKGSPPSSATFHSDATSKPATFMT